MSEPPNILPPPEQRKRLHKELKVPVTIRLPSPPMAVLKLQQLFQDPNINFRKLADAISLDPAMSASVLRLARSPLFGLARPPRTLLQAVASIGMAELERMVVTQIAVQTLASSPPALRLFLQEAYGTALITRSLCRRHEPLLDPGLAWPAGLLFDIGKLVRLTLEPDQDEEIRRAMLIGASGYAKAEASLSLQNQHVLGASLLYKWQLPLIYVDVALYGERSDPLSWPGTQESLALRRIVSAASSLRAVTLERTSSQERAAHQARAQDLLQLNEDAFLAEMAVVYQLLPTVQSLL
ncbi:MAG: HD-like signal output (HDOD) protein [Cognaticolwellia sp.]